MALDRASRQEEELKLLLRTQFNYKIARERIRFKYEEYLPIIDAHRAGKGVMGIPDGTAFEIKVIESADSDRPAAKADDAA